MAKERKVMTPLVKIILNTRKERTERMKKGVISKYIREEDRDRDRDRETERERGRY